MFYSKYNYYIYDYPHFGYTTIYNIFTKEAVCYLSKMLFPLPVESIKETLYNKGIVIKIYGEDLEQAENYYKDKVTNKKKLRIILVLTGECNCSCCYCYEKNNFNLPNEFSCKQELIKFVERKFADSNLEDFDIIFTGGEPLLKKRIINELATYFHAQYGDLFSFFIITNGTLLDSKDISFWVKNGLKMIKITLDGNNACHNARRPYKSGKGTYNVILDNLSKINSDLKIVINIVLSPNVFGVDELLEDLKKREINASISINLEEHASLDKDSANLLLKYAKLLKARGFIQHSKLSGPHGDICDARKNNCYTIDGYGQVYECNAEFRKIGIINGPLKKQLYDYTEECKQCKYLPICYGECPYYNYCPKNYYDYLVPRLLKVYLSYQQ